MNAKIPVIVICVEAIIYLLLYNFDDCIFIDIFISAVAVSFLNTNNLVELQVLPKENSLNLRFSKDIFSFENLLDSYVTEFILKELKLEYKIKKKIQFTSICNLSPLYGN